MPCEWDLDLHTSQTSDVRFVLFDGLHVKEHWCYIGFVNGHFGLQVGELGVVSDELVDAILVHLGRDGVLSERLQLCRVFGKLGPLAAIGCLDVVTQRRAPVPMIALLCTLDA